MSQEFALQNIHRLTDIYDGYRPYIRPYDQHTILRYLAWIRILHNEGAFEPDNEDILRNMKWSRHNVRHGGLSILGTCGEVFALGLMNQRNNYTQFKLSDGKQASEVAGADLLACQPNWKRDYPVQVKYVRDLIGFSKDPRWLKYKKLDRLVLSDINNHRVLHVDYAPFVKFATPRTFLTLDDLQNEPSLNAYLYK